MKHTNGTNIGKYFALAISALTITLSMVGCGNKDGGGGTPAVVGVGASCVGCSATMTKVVASANGRSSFSAQNYAELSLNFFGDTATGASVSGYYGSIAATGILRIHTAITAGCVIPAGDYSVSTLSPGQWTGMSFNRLQLQASGPALLRLDINYGQIQAATPAVTDWAGATFPYFLVLPGVTVTSMSTGGYCNPLYFQD